MKISKEYRKSFVFLLQWLVISVTAGISGSLMVALFHILIGGARDQILTYSIPVPIWTLTGALICGLLFYRLSPSASGDGIPSYIRGVLDARGEYPLRETIAKFAATLTALMTLSAGGMLGPAGRVSAGINSRIALFLSKGKILVDQRRTAAICGMAAAVGAIFHSPVGGGIFAVEVLQRANMRYSDLFPAILSSSVAVYIYNFFPISPPLKFTIPPGQFDSALMPPIILTALVAALAGRLYTILFERISRIYSKGNRQKVIAKLISGAAIASLLVFAFSPALVGNIPSVAQSVFSGDPLPVREFLSSLPYMALCIILIIIVAVASSVSIGSGISVGMTSPSILIGLLVGAFAANLLGFNPGEGEYYFLLVAGFTGLLSSTVNVPVGAAVIAIETFGASYGFCAGVSSVIGFQINRHHTLYDFSLEDTD